MYFVSKGPGAIRGLTFEDALAFVGRTLNGIGRSRPESDVDLRSSIGLPRRQVYAACLKLAASPATTAGNAADIDRTPLRRHTHRPCPQPEVPLMTHHHLHSSPETCHWGFFEAKLKPVLSVASGDEVTVDTISGGPDVVPDRDKFHVPPELAEVHAKSERMLPGHILTGPIAVEAAAPGDVLEVEILDVRLRQDWGYNMIRPLAGTLPDDFHETRLLNIPLDQKRMVGRLPWGLDLPLKPFFGVMGVAPPPGWGRITSLIPRAMGGNLDNKELTPGAKLYLPVFVPGALFSCGDGHGVQGDGEVCVTAIETALQGRFKLTLRKDLRLNYPRAETPTHYMTMAMDPDLDQCVVRALRDMIVLLGEKRNLSREDAYTLCSLAADLRVTQTVNGSKGIHCMIAKTVVHG